MERVDFEGLKNYLLNLTAEDIRNQIGLKECSCQNEIERQEKRCDGRAKAGTLSNSGRVD